MAHPSQLGFQDAASPMMEEFIYFHDHTLMMLILVSTLVLYMIITLVSTKLTNSLTLDSQELEIVWTILPALMLFFIAFPSVRILYVSDEFNDTLCTIKAIGHQWYWSYEYTDYMDLEFDAYMLPTDTLMPGQYRLLDPDHRLVVPTEARIRTLITADDVLHAWAVPALGVKVDAIPGRLNQTTFMALRPGIFFGQCSEICGANHSFMPIAVEAIPLEYFDKWLTTMLTEIS